jgi:hypothetical protein
LKDLVFHRFLTQSVLPAFSYPPALRDGTAAALAGLRWYLGMGGFGSGDPGAFSSWTHNGHMESARFSESL